VPLWPGILFLLVWCVFLGVLVAIDAPLFFTAVFGVFAVLILRGIIELAFGTTRTTITGDAVVVERSTLGRRRVRRIARAAIIAVQVKVGTTMNGPSGKASRAWHDVKIRHEDGDLRVVRHVPTRSEAEWLAAEMRKLLGLR
jgi:hypothetical protein